MTLTNNKNCLALYPSPDRAFPNDQPSLQRKNYKAGQQLPWPHQPPFPWLRLIPMPLVLLARLFSSKRQNLRVLRPSSASWKELFSLEQIQHHLKQFSSKLFLVSRIALLPSFAAQMSPASHFYQTHRYNSRWTILTI